MTSTLPHDVRDAFESFITCELTTVDATKQPITWPVTPYYDRGGPTIDVTTGLGYPKKADDAKAHPSVSLLFSDPTGSGIDSGLRVLVQGTAMVDDEDLKANAERYIRESGVKLPATKKMNPPKPLRPMFNWYYARLYIKVRPERVFVWPEGNLAAEPAIHDAHLEEVRSGHIEEPPEDHGEAPKGPPAWDQRMEYLAEHDTGVLSWMGPDGFPIAVRVPFAADAYPMLFDVGWSTSTGIQEPDSWLHQLLKVLVAGYYHYVHARLDTLGHESPVYVISFVAGERHVRNTVSVQYLADAVHAAIEIRLQLFAQFFAGSLISRIPLVAERKTRIMHPTEVIGLVLGNHALKKVCYAPARRSVLSFARRERTRDQCKKGTIDERVPVDQKQPRASRTIHEVNIKRLRVRRARRRSCNSSPRRATTMVASA
jgi:hypothetical protein